MRGSEGAAEAAADGNKGDVVDTIVEGETDEEGGGGRSEEEKEKEKEEDVDPSAGAVP